MTEAWPVPAGGVASTATLRLVTPRAELSGFGIAGNAI